MCSSSTYSRCSLEAKVGTQRLVQAYQFLTEFDRGNLEDTLNYSKLVKILGDCNNTDNIIDEIFQLVLSDQIFNNR